MKVKATTSFAGEICMAKGEGRDVPENIAAPLLDCGYLEAEQDAEPEMKKTRRAKTKTEADV